MSFKLDWPEKYCVEKFLPLLTKWHLQDNVPCRTIQPVEIKKKRNPRGVPSFVVVWKDIDSQYEALIPDDQFEDGEDILTPWTTVERQDLMRQYYPELVERYEDSIRKPSKQKKTKVQKKTASECNEENGTKPKRKYNRKPKQGVEGITDLNDSLKNLSLTNKNLNTSKANVSVCINKLKRKIKNNTKVKIKNTIESYLQPKKRRESSKLIQSLSNSLNNISLINHEAKDLNNKEDDSGDKDNVDGDKHLLSMLNLSEGDVNDSDLSDIVENIISRHPPATMVKVNSNFAKLIFENKKKSIFYQRFSGNCSTPKNSPSRSSCYTTMGSRRSSSSKANTSYFFDKLTDERDAFEISVEYKHKIAAINLDCDATLNYSLPHVSF